MSVLGNTLLNIGTSLFNNFIAQKREDHARQENFRYGELAADAADKRTRALYEDYQTYGAQLQQIKDAGLSPSLLAGGTGAGGMTQGAQGTGATGIAPTTYGIDIAQGAQIANIIADTKLKNAEADNLEGETPEAKARIGKLLSETDNTDLKNAYQEYENSLAMLEVSVKASTRDQEVERIAAESKKAVDEARSAKVKGDIDEATMNDAIDYVKERNKNLMEDTFLKEANRRLANSQMKLNKVQAQSLINSIMTSWEDLRIKGETNTINREKLHALVQQWEKENDIKRRGQNIEIGKTITSTIIDLQKNFIDLIDAVVPL